MHLCLFGSVSLSDCLSTCILAFPELLLDLTGSADGSVRMFEFGTEKAVSVQRPAGSAPGVTRIRFTPQGNKVEYSNWICSVT